MNCCSRNILAPFQSLLCTIYTSPNQFSPVFWTGGWLSAWRWYCVGVNTPMRYRQLRVKDLPKVPTWGLERDSEQRPSGRMAPLLLLIHHAPFNSERRDCCSRNLSSCYKLIDLLSNVSNCNVSPAKSAITLHTQRPMQDNANTPVWCKNRIILYRYGSGLENMRWELTGDQERVRQEDDRVERVGWMVKSSQNYVGWEDCREL